MIFLNVVSVISINYWRQKTIEVQRILMILKYFIWNLFICILRNFALNHLKLCRLCSVHGKTWNLDTAITSANTLCPVNFKVLFVGYRSNIKSFINFHLCQIYLKTQLITCFRLDGPKRGRFYHIWIYVMFQGCGSVSKNDQMDNSEL